ncbi:MAG: YdcF family protein [Hyphomicrobiaceae bacterium]
MAHILSKVIGFLLLPSSLLMASVVAGLVLVMVGRRRGGLFLSGLGVVGLLVAGLSPLANIALRPLEERFPAVAPAEFTGPIEGIIILGGAEDGRVSARRGGRLHLNEAAERVTEAATLARMLPKARVVFTGGVGGLTDVGPSGAEHVGRYLVELGIASERILLEGASRNTYENARYTAAMLGATAGQRWLLVTSAHHMPRSVGVFRAAGIDVLAYPVDYRTAGAEDGALWFSSLPAGLQRTDLAAREWLGLVFYRLTGRTGELLPAPRGAATS